MRILLLGSGGREHALAWKISQSNLCSALFIAPGNAGTEQHGTNIKLNLHDFDVIYEFCLSERIEMLIVGPEEPLVNGIADFFLSADPSQNISVIGPLKNAALLEGSKSFAKAFMKRNNIPTAGYGEFDADSYHEGINYLNKHALPIVLKADGLASGKGVLICKNHEEAIAEFELMIQKNKFGAAGRKVVVEEFLEGIELSVFALTDGKNYVILPEAKDYKKIGEGDSGLNTGGMGAVSPVPFVNAQFMQKIEDKVIRPTIEGLKKEMITYNGFIFFGLIKVRDEPFVIEYNCRLGDPETEVLIPRLKNDLVELFIATSQQKLDTISIVTDDRTACTVVAVSGGYPEEFEKGYQIQGLKDDTNKQSLVFHAATTRIGDDVITSGGRVLCVTSFGSSVEEAVKFSTEFLQGIYFKNIYYRKDIGFEFK